MLFRNYPNNWWTQCCYLC